MQINGFSAARRRANLGLNVDIGIWSDSTANQSTEWPWLIAAEFAAAYPTATVRIQNGTSASFVNDPQIIQAGSGDQVITLWVFAVAGTVLMYGMGSLFNRVLRMPHADVMIVSHGLNHASGGWQIQVMRGEFLGAIETYKHHHPETPIVVVKQNPFQNSTLMTPVVDMITDLSTRRDYSVVDVHASFVAAGKPLSWYADGDATHPSATGQQVYSDLIWAHWEDAAAVIAPPAPSVFDRLIDRDQNLLLNGGFEDWDSTLPDNWTAGGAGTLTCVKETSIVKRASQGYSASLLATGDQAWLEQSIPSDLRQMAWDSRITLAALVYRDPTGNDTQGRITLTSGGSTTINSRPYRTQQDGWVWVVISGYEVERDAAFVTARLWADSSATPGANPIYFDQAVCIPGCLPARCYA